MNKTGMLSLVACLSLILGCGADGDGQSSKKTSGHVWSEQTNAIGKSQEVDQVIQQAADRQREAIEQQSK